MTINPEFPAFLVWVRVRGRRVEGCALVVWATVVNVYMASARASALCCRFVVGATAPIPSGRVGAAGCQTLERRHIFDDVCLFKNITSRARGELSRWYVRISPDVSRFECFVVCVCRQLTRECKITNKKVLCRGPTTHISVR